MLDPLRARAEADAAELWAAGPGEWGPVSVGTVTQPEAVPTVEQTGEAAPVLPRVLALRRAEAPRVDPARSTVEVPVLTAMRARLQMAQPVTSGVPAWLVEAVGNPLTYDAAAAHRKEVCARADRTLYRRLLNAKARFGLRTTADAWEYMLRAGLAVAGRDGAVFCWCGPGVNVCETQARRDSSRAHLHDRSRLAQRAR